MRYFLGLSGSFLPTTDSASIADTLAQSISMKGFRSDGIGRPMPLIPLGTYAVLPGTVWVISSYNRFSFDSRYFGAIHLDERVQIGWNRATHAADPARNLCGTSWDCLGHFFLQPIQLR